MTTIITALAVDVYTYIPKNAVKFVPELEKEQEHTLNGFVLPQYFGSLIEHETCITLTRSGCWSPKQQFKTKWSNGLPREQGAGLGMLTRAWKQDGSIRMDSLLAIKKRFPKELEELSWNNITDRPDLQMRSMILLWKSGFDQLPNDIDIGDRIAMADSIYNGGFKYLYRERAQCKLRKGCDPKMWFNNVENENARGTKVLYGNRTAYEINRNHVIDVFVIRIGKYIKLWGK